jgi:ATP-dependent Lon protease
MHQITAGEGGKPMKFELTGREADVLKETLDVALSELRMEIADTDKKDFRDMLKEKKQLLIGIVDRLDEARSGREAREPELRE